MSWTPHDLPHLVEKLAAESEQDKAMLDEVRDAATLADNSPYIALAERQQLIADMLRVATLAWMDSEVSELVQESSTSVPEWSPVAAMPYPCGVVAFERRVMQAPEDEGPDPAMVDIDAIAWQVRGAEVFVMALSRRRGATRPTTGKIAQSIRRSLPSMPLPPMPIPQMAELFTLAITLDAPQGGDDPAHLVEQHDGMVLDTYEGAGVELLRVIGAVWLLMGQPRVVEEAEDIASTVRSSSVDRGGRVVRGEKRPVRVSVRSLSPHAQASHRGGRGEATSRWWVRGHWRQQAWGKGRQLRKPLYIEPHTAGSRDAAEPDEDDRPSVQVWRK